MRHGMCHGVLAGAYLLEAAGEVAGSGVDGACVGPASTMAEHDAMLAPCDALCKAPCNAAHLGLTCTRNESAGGEWPGQDQDQGQGQG